MLELDGVSFIDQAGLNLLEPWAGEKLVLRGGSFFVRTLLMQCGLVPGAGPSP